MLSPFDVMRPSMHKPTKSADVVSINSRSVLASMVNPEATLIRMAGVMAITGMARSTIYKTMKVDPSFPKPVKFGESGARSAPVGFVLGEVQSWVKAKIANRDEDSE
jgi:prophage regulatory protein